jgi:hypothetical protein
MADSSWGRFLPVLFFAVSIDELRHDRDLTRDPFCGFALRF